MNPERWPGEPLRERLTITERQEVQAWFVRSWLAQKRRDRYEAAHRPKDGSRVAGLKDSNLPESIPGDGRGLRAHKRHPHGMPDQRSATANESRP